MKRYFKLIIVTALLLIVFTPAIKAATLGDLLYGFRWRINEWDSTSSLLPDTALMLFLNDAQHSVARLSDDYQTRTDITFSVDSQKYALPADFKRLKYVMVWTGSAWEYSRNNPGFTTDTGSFQHFVTWENSTQAEIYLKGQYYYDGMTARVFYFGTPPDMVARTDSCYLPEALIGLIYEEAMSYYKMAKQDDAAFQLLNQAVRQDLGIKLQKEQGRK